MPKINKPSLSMRSPVFSNSTPNAKFLTEILTLAHNTDIQFYIKDSFHFSVFVNNFKLPVGTITKISIIIGMKYQI